MNNWEEDIIEEFCDEFCHGCADPHIKCALVTENFLQWIKQEIKNFSDDVRNSPWTDCEYDRDDLMEKLLKERGIE